MIDISQNERIPNINKELFIKHIFNRCDKVSFHFPNFEQRGCGSKMKMNKDYREYIEKNAELLEVIKPHIIKNEIVKRYFGMRYSHACDMYVFKLTKDFKRFFIKYDNLYDWQYPDLPEDICFFEKKTNKCWLQTFAHEYRCVIYNENENDLKVLEMCEIEYHKYSNEMDGFPPAL